MTPSAELRALVTPRVELLCLDAGNTVIFLDHHRLAELLREAVSFVTTAETLVRAEGEAKRRAEPSAEKPTGDLFDCDWGQRDRPGAPAWGRMVGTILVHAGVSEDVVPTALGRLWRSHEARNLWCKVPEGLGEALDAMRAGGAKVAIISNSEGMLERLFRELGILDHFDLVVDSGVAGVEKPDPRIYRIAFDHFGVTPEAAVHLGDVFATDILGARAAGCRYALIDPFGHYAGRHLDVPRVAGVVSVADAIRAVNSQR